MCYCTLHQAVVTESLHINSIKYTRYVNFKTDRCFVDVIVIVFFFSFFFKEELNFFRTFLKM